MAGGDDQADRLLGRIEQERDELVSLALELSNLPDLAGHERPVAEAVHDWFGRNGILAELQPLSATSANVVATVPGTPAAGGTAGVAGLILSAHLDTEGGPPRDPADQQRLRGAWRDGDLLIGKGLVNCKAQVAAQLVALRAVAREGSPRTGDLVFLGTAMETGGAVDLGTPVGDLAADQAAPAGTWPHVAEGSGAVAALARGLRGRAAIVGEPTGFGICQAQAGYLRVMVRVPGFIPYTPFIQRGPAPADNPNSIERAGRVILALEGWAARYAERERTVYPEATVAPRAQVLGIRSPRFVYTEDADPCDVFVDIRTLPERDEAGILAELTDMLASLAVGAEVIVQDRRTGRRARGAEGIVRVLTEAHRRVFRESPNAPAPEQTSMWHDTNAFNAAGIPAISYGIAVRREAHTREKVRAALVDDLVRLAKVYALAAIGAIEA